MKIPSLTFREKEFDILLIEADGISYFKIESQNGRVNVLKNEKVKNNIFTQNTLDLINFESALTQIVSRYQIQELGVIIHLPNILFQKLNLVKGVNMREAIYNYLKTTFPLPLDQYIFFFKEDTFQKTGFISLFNIYLINKELINRLLIIVEKYNLIPIFITFSGEVFYQYLLNKTLLDFYEDYLIFFLDTNVLTVLFIKNLRIEKIIFEHLSPETNIDFTLLRFYNFFRPNFSNDTKILLFTEVKITLPSEITQPQFVFDLQPKELFLEGGKILFEKVLNDEEFIDFLPLKPHLTYFIRRLPKILNLLSIYLGSLILIFTSFYFYVNFRLSKETKKLTSQIVTLQKSDAENKVKNFLNLTKSLDTELLSKFQLLTQIKSLDAFEKVEFTKDKIAFSLKTTLEKKEGIKLKVSQLIPQARLINEEISGAEVRLTYQF